jgi:D-3-phosphoglycerate dehydrogenase / 2-oxoglutarate reductase
VIFIAKTSLPKDKIKFLLLEGPHQSVISNLKAAGYENIEYVKSALPNTELLKKIGDFHFLGIRSRTKISKEILDAAKKLIGIGCFCIGTNQVDLTEALIRGIPVFNAPYSNTRSVAELVLGEIILLLRGIPSKNANAHRGIWEKSSKYSFEIRGKKLGIIGYGNIGSQLGTMAESLGMQVFFYDLNKKLPLGNAIQVHNMNKLLEQSDIISLHVPETTLTKGMVDQQFFNKMKKGSILINASRGSVVDMNALTKALKDNHLLGAAIDVYPKEPKSNSESFKSPLQEFDNVILTPHVGGSTIEAQENIAEEVIEKLIRYSDNGSTIGAVNFPGVSLPSHPGKHRLIHIHQNIPGILSKINNIFSENNINISGQYLQTNKEVGYVVIDVDAEYSKLALEKIGIIEGTLRTRVLF